MSSCAQANTRTKTHTSGCILSLTRRRVNFRSRRFRPAAGGEEICSLTAVLTFRLVSLRLGEVLKIDDRGHPRVPCCMTSWNVVPNICMCVCAPHIRTCMWVPLSWHILNHKHKVFLHEESLIYYCCSRLELKNWILQVGRQEHGVWWYIALGRDLFQ